MKKITNAAEFFEEFYRINKVGETLESKLAFWEIMEPKIPFQNNPSSEERLEAYEWVYKKLNKLDEEPIIWPSQDKIFFDRWYFDRGVNAKDPKARLRYHRFHNEEVIKVNVLPEDPREQLIWWETNLIGDYLFEIDPEAQLC